MQSYTREFGSKPAIPTEAAVAKFPSCVTPGRGSLGLGLVESLVVLAVLAVLLSIGALSFHRYLQEERAREAARVVSESIRRASDQALRESRLVRVAVEDDELVWSHEGTQLGRESLPHGAAIVSVVPGGPIEISGRGLPLQQYEITIERGGIERFVYVLPTSLVVTR